MSIIKKIEQAQIEKLKGDKKIPAFKSGDTVKVHVKIKDGDKFRIQVFEGVVIARDGGDGGDLLRRAPVVDGDGSLIVGDHAGEAVLDPVHGIGAQGVGVADLITGPGELFLHIPLPALQANHPHLLVGLHLGQNGALELGVALRPHGVGVVLRHAQAVVGGHRLVLPLQHGRAACQGQGQGQERQEPPQTGRPGGQ